MLQARCKLRGESLYPTGVDQADLEEIEKVHLILAPIGCEFHPHQGFQRKDAK